MAGSPTMDVFETLRAWIGAGTTRIAEIPGRVRDVACGTSRSLANVLGLTTGEEMMELRRRVDELEALVRHSAEDDGPARASTVSPRMKESLARASAALGGVTGSTRRARTGSSE
ncbi:MAG: hypothetical protein L0206_16235 [Actinobacteria bacterium]|nr:hypothetical protein [Actinomycetota bacterium]